jgi:hypothetical protein
MTEPCGACRLSSPPVEILDWGYARNRRAVLMTTSAEWSQSLYSCLFESGGRRLIAPNRDYPYEGLLAHQEGENWKILDCVAVGLRDAAGAYLKLQPDPVTLDPWQVTYAYRAQGEVPLRVTYYLASPAGPEATTGCVSVYVPAGAGRRGLTQVVQPLQDNRHIY